MKPLIPPVDRAILKSELTPDKFFRPTNKAHNEIYLLNAHNAPNVMLEIGRLRELSFRIAGGGTGNEIDTDRYDYLEKPYTQLIVWDPVAREIVGGYRYLHGKEVTFLDNGQPDFVMSHLFHFSDKFIQNYLPSTIELGRAFIQPDYQSSKMGLKSLFALDNLWDGLGALIHSETETHYFIGKVTIFEHYPITARELIYEYMNHYFADDSDIVTPKGRILTSKNGQMAANKVFSWIDKNDDFKLLQKAIRALGETIPPLYTAYIGLTNTMRYFGSIQDHAFGSVYEAGIMITISDLFESKRKRYIDPYIEYLKIVLGERKQAKQEEKFKKMRNKQRF